jgi:hypothetical protein
MANASPPNFFIALATLMPPPPASYTRGAQRNFFSGFKASTELLISTHGLSVIVTMEGIDVYLVFLNTLVPVIGAIGVISGLSVFMQTVHRSR